METGEIRDAPVKKLNLHAYRCVCSGTGDVSMSKSTQVYTTILWIIFYRDYAVPSRQEKKLLTAM